MYIYIYIYMYKCVSFTIKKAMSRRNDTGRLQFVCVYVCVCERARVCMYVCMYICIYIHTHEGVSFAINKEIMRDQEFDVS